MSVEVTGDAKVAEKSRDADVTVQAEIYRNATQAEKASPLRIPEKPARPGPSWNRRSAACGPPVAAPAAGQKAALEREISILRAKPGPVEQRGVLQVLTQNASVE